MCGFWFAGAYTYVSELWKKKQSDVMRFLLRVRCWEYRQLPAVVRVTHPTRPDKARRLGYKAKQVTPFFICYFKLLLMGRLLIHCVENWFTLWCAVIADLGLRIDCLEISVACVFLLSFCFMKLKTIFGKPCICWCLLCIFFFVSSWWYYPLGFNLERPSCCGIWLLIITSCSSLMR